MLHKARLHALISGGSRGIGAATAACFAQAGYAVTILYHKNAKMADSLVDSLRQSGHEAIAISVDIKDFTSVRHAVQKVNIQIGAVDVLVSNAGIAGQMLFTDVLPEDFKEMMDTHVTGLYNITHAVLPGMISRKTGSIITVSSVWG